MSGSDTVRSSNSMNHSSIQFGGASLTSQSSSPHNQFAVSASYAMQHPVAPSNAGNVGASPNNTIGSGGEEPVQAQFGPWVIQHAGQQGAQSARTSVQPEGSVQLSPQFVQPPLQQAPQVPQQVVRQSTPMELVRELGEDEPQLEKRVRVEQVSIRTYSPYQQAPQVQPVQQQQPVQQPQAVQQVNLARRVQPPRKAKERALREHLAQQELMTVRGNRRGSRAIQNLAQEQLPQNNRTMIDTVDPFHVTDFFQFTRAFPHHYNEGKTYDIQLKLQSGRELELIRRKLLLSDLLNTYGGPEPTVEQIQHSETGATYTLAGGGLHRAGNGTVRFTPPISGNYEAYILPTPAATQAGYVVQQREIDRRGEYSVPDNRTQDIIQANRVREMPPYRQLAPGHHADLSNGGRNLGLKFDMSFLG
ncbi:MAG: hypothetical protein KF874_05475 [Rhizobiaceae bacterium]|nr:hypothetical protein [Rhizobiaceae bacterium]